MSEETQSAPAGSWKDALPEALRDAPYFKKAETVDQVLADLQGAAAWQGNSLRIPGPDATPEQVAEFRARAQERIPGLMAVPDPDAEDYTATLRKLGLPEAADKYKVPEDIGIEGEQLGNLMAQAFNAGLTQAQFSKLLNDQVSTMRENQEAFEARQAQESAALKGEWGQAYQERMGVIEHFLKDAPAEIADAFPTMSAEGVRWLYGLAESMREGNESVRQADGQAAKMTPLEAHEQVRELTARLTTMRETDDPKLYQHLVQKRVDLMRQTQG